jgi:hypothetical protein
MRAMVSLTLIASFTFGLCYAANCEIAQSARNCNPELKIFQVISTRLISVWGSLSAIVLGNASGRGKNPLGLLNG